MGQPDTTRAAIRIAHTKAGTNIPAADPSEANGNVKDPGAKEEHWHAITNNSFRHGRGWAVNIDTAFNTRLENNVVHYHIGIGF